MKFDDVNYEAYNKYILVDPDSSGDGDEAASRSDEKSNKLKSEKQSQNKANFEDGQSSKLTEKNMETTQIKSYQFDELNTLTKEEQEEQIRLEKIMMEEERQFEKAEKERMRIMKLREQDEEKEESPTET